MSRELPTRAGVVVIGGGVVGLACAYELARGGVRDVVLLERDSLGAGSTCKAAGGVRAQFSDSLNIALGARSLETFENFESRFGTPIDLHQVGYLFLLDTPERVAEFERSCALQRAVGLDSRVIDVAEAQRLSPYIDTDGLLAAAWTPRDGHCTPEAVVLGYAGAARRAGVTIVTACEVTGIDVDGADITGVRTERGTAATDAVVCAAGAWSARIGELVGVDLPVTPVRRQILISEPIPGLPRDTPFTIDAATSFYFHNEGNGLLLGMSDPSEPPGFSVCRDDAWLEPLGEVIARRAPALADVGMCSGWAGLYENTPDHNALIGESEHVSRFLYATGFSGHGFLQAPAVGEVIAAAYRGEPAFVDVSALSADRFATAGARPELNIV